MRVVDSLSKRRSEKGESPGGAEPGASFVVGALLFCGAFGLYLATLAPTVLYYDLPDLRDSAVLQTRAYVLGVPDYTGYPTYIVLAHLFTYLPFGDPAYRVNLASAVYAGGAVALTFASARLLTGRIAVSLAGALAFALGPIFWSQAVIAEVYSLNALLVAASVAVLLMWSRARRDGYLLLACSLMGLSLTNHITSGLVVAGAFVLVGLTERRKLLEWRLGLKGGLLFLAGLLPYLYLPLRASMDYLPEGLAWGQPAVRRYPPDTLYGFYNLVSGGEWGERLWAFGPSALAGRTLMYLDRLCGSGGEFGVWFVALGVAGGFYLVYRHPPEGCFLALLYFGWLFHALEYDIEDIEVYFIPTFFITSLFAAVGLSGGLGLLERYAPGGSLKKAAAAGLPLLALAFVFAGVGEKFRASDMSEDFRGREIMDAVASETPGGATVLHHRSPLDYMVAVENRRTDLKLVPYLEEINSPGIVRGVVESRRAPTYVLFPAYASTIYSPGVEQSQRFYRRYGYDLTPVNRDLLLYRVVPPGGG
ncbi:DUF2723 domain-containing protein [Rubrobacter indicoceani]|uniref:glycosyltransferase family 117 protein n=1 Tax=Rubrobacter indicoceani TaxID=2051957 RepID=UPI000E5B9204|nr:DUF2723 domain-containing protein [Rubrobacter indicoceani]